MQDELSVWYRPIRQRPSYAMRDQTAPGLQFDLAVPASALEAAARPVPTRLSLVDVRPETLDLVGRAGLYGYGLEVHSAL